MKARLYSEFFEAWLNVEADEETKLGDALKEAEDKVAVFLVDNQAKIFFEFDSLDKWEENRKIIEEVDHFLRLGY